MSVRGACQNNLKNIDIDLDLGRLTVITGISGSGKSSLAFDTIYAEGQRRYVETFSPYARQFLDRMDKPAARRIDGIPPAIAIDQTNPVRTSRSTVGTMTELNDHLKLLFARIATPYCPGCGDPVRTDNAHSIADALLSDGAAAQRMEIRFSVPVPENFTEQEIRAVLKRQGYTRVYSAPAPDTAHQGDSQPKADSPPKADSEHLEVVQARLRREPERRTQLIEALEAALKHGRGLVRVTSAGEDSAGEDSAWQDSAWQRSFSARLHCAQCDRELGKPLPNLFSFNSPLGACPECRGFGRTMGIDFDRVVPDTRKSLAGGAVKPFQSSSYQECQRDLMKHAKKRGLDTACPWHELDESTRQWVLEGESSMRSGKWYGVRRFFDWLERKSYRMHIRVLLARYRSYDTCAVCEGARLVPEALDWRLGSKAGADAVLAPEQRITPHHSGITVVDARALPGLSIHDLMTLPIARSSAFFERLTLPGALHEATELLLGEIRSRLSYLNQVGLGYLTLDRQSRTLSGGEVQRINLTTALGTSLVNTLFVLDEPSIGLHARDMERVTQVLARLRDAGNTLLVVEHDPMVMMSADRIIDMGPKAGESGGEVVFHGPPKALLKHRRSLTGQYLSGRRTVDSPNGDAPNGDAPDNDDSGDADLAREALGPPRPRLRRNSIEDVHCITVHGARENNLKNLDATIPLDRLVVVTGVSGSGKSTLVHDVLYRGLRRRLGRPDGVPGLHGAISGESLITDVVMVDQTAIGKTTRSNPASFVGALDVIRKLFAGQPLALERGYTAGTFSFNSGNGRCPRCGGNGFEHVEMQFLSDVYLRCPDCDGKRYRAEVLEVQYAPPFTGMAGTPHSIAEVLDLTIAEALAFFSSDPDLYLALKPLLDVGLEYLRLGQPVPTLSGGEAQRLKLAGHLAKQMRRRSDLAMLGTLFLFDEPTTGLHFHDVAKLLDAFRALIAAGNAVLVIEHNLDLIRAADWLLDLGPEGGDEGGALLFAGPPEKLQRNNKNYTGRALAGLYEQLAAAAKKPPKRGVKHNAIAIINAREHNLQGVTVDIPRGCLAVITGVSGSGKSTLAFDILFAEGQRRYLESLNAYARQFVQPSTRPEVDAITGLPPTVAIEQRSSRGGRKSTVGTVTEVHHFLRLLYVKLGTQYCPDCDVPIRAQREEAVAAAIMSGFKGQDVTLLAPQVVARKGYYTELADWASRQGFNHLRVDGETLAVRPWPRLNRFVEHDIDLPVAKLHIEPGGEDKLATALATALKHGKGLVRVAGRRKEILYNTERACPSCSRSFAPLDPRLFSYNSKHGWCPACFGTGLAISAFDEEQSGEESTWAELDENALKPCQACAGARLNPTGRKVRFKGRGIAEYAALTVVAAAKTISTLKLHGREAGIARDILPELYSRLAFLQHVGLGYLCLDRAAPTLSGGEAQRIRLAAQLGSNLRGVCYVLDEPTIGLHPRDNALLLDTLDGLKANGNTVVIVEHDEDTIRRADYVVDLGPGAGVNGGEVVAAGTLAQVQRQPTSVTGAMLAAPLAHPLVTTHRGKAGKVLRIEGASTHNLRHIDVAIPLERLVCVSGVSGSGKSTLVREVLLRNAQNLLAKRGQNPAKKPGRPQKSSPHKSSPKKSNNPNNRGRLTGCTAIHGLNHLERVLEVDQSPIGKTPRSCPATYVGIWDYIRKLYAEATEARLRGYGPARFSFNVKGGRCDACEGQGLQRIAMNFLPDVRVPCDICGGRRFNSETLAVTHKGLNISQVLALSIEEAAEFFSAHEQVHRTLTLLRDIGLGYLTLGQASPTLSGGEAQRVKLVSELAKAASRTLFVLDEPTTGLHMADVEKLILVLHRLVDAGHSVIVIEHNLDIIAEADHVLDIGPEGGAGGGRVVAKGAPAALVRRKRHTHTSRVLAAFLSRRKCREAH
ncbi:MAG: excinuclease ABC subunit A [Gammaproteobacteria bacterium]|nr:excinuclease ABC subunit A [Gammaproteobacteria bacterium]